MQPPVTVAVKAVVGSAVSVVVAAVAAVKVAVAANVAKLPAQHFKRVTVHHSATLFRFRALFLIILRIFVA